MNTIRAEIVDAVVPVKYGYKACLAVLASICNDLSFKLGLAFMPKDATKEQPAFDARIAEGFGIDGMKPAKVLQPADVSVGFCAAQLLLVDKMNQPDPERFGSTNEWATRYLRDGAMIIKNITDWRAKNELAQAQATVEQLTRAGIKVDLTEKKKAIDAEAANLRTALADQVNEELRQALTKVKGKSTEELWEIVMDTYDEIDENMTARVYASLVAILGAQARRLSTNAGFVQIDEGVVSLKVALTPTAPTVQGKAEPKQA